MSERGIRAPADEGASTRLRVHSSRLPPVQLVLFTVLGACVTVIAYAFNVSGPVCALLFLGGVFTGALLRVARPIIDWLTRP
ncbi:MAG TPA: hypothetical protein VFY33_05895 [Solirubrobacterales bacterium]|nr:hypothetical protein [Solirubrobacterales bacterium]